MRDAENRPVRMVGTITDITDRKNAEDALAQANQELERRIAERTAELELLNRELEARVAERTAELAQEMRRREEAQMRLAQVQKMEAVGQLTAGIAHDFNNLLAVIRGSLGLIEAEAARGLTAELELIDAAMRATRRGADLVRRLLAFSRQSSLKTEPTAVDQLVLDTLRLMQRTLGEHIAIETHLNAAASMVSVDRNQLANVAAQSGVERTRCDAGWGPAHHPDDDANRPAGPPKEASPDGRPAKRSASPSATPAPA